MDLLSRLDRMIDERHLLTHPFYTKWTAGTLPIESMQEYTRQYFAFESAFPQLLSGLHTRTDDAATRQEILDNLWDEEHGPENHAELWLRFAEGIGVDRKDVQEADLNPATERLVETYRDLVREAPVAAGLAALYAYERQVPEVAQSKIDGLRDHYDVTDPRATRFFVVHGVLDVEHSGREREMVGRLATDADEPAITDATDRALGAWWDFLSAVDAPTNTSSEATPAPAMA
jgi:pyrroloquinoline-quinone synthase